MAVVRALAVQIDPDSLDQGAKAAQGAAGDWWTYPGLLALGAGLWKGMEAVFAHIRNTRMFGVDVATKESEIDVRIAGAQQAFIDKISQLHETERRVWIEDRKAMKDDFDAERIRWHAERVEMRAEIVVLRTKVDDLEKQLHLALER